MIARNRESENRRPDGKIVGSVVSRVRITEPDVIPLTPEVLEELGADVGDSIEFGRIPGEEKLCIRKYDPARVGGPEFESLAIVPIQFELENEGARDGEA